MKRFTSILYPTDMTENADKLVPYVKTLAATFDARLHLLYVARRLQHFTTMYVPTPSVKAFEIEVLQGGEKRLEEFRTTHFGDIPGVTASVVPGDPAEEILNYVGAHGIELVVIGTHGRKGLDRVLFGSVAERVIKSATVPVFVVNPYGISEEQAG